MKTIIKKLKPIDIDINFIYKCPSCSIEHWLTLKETQEPKFIIVCDCGEKYKIKTIDNINIKYRKKSSSQAIPPSSKMPVDILDQCSTILTGYGFDKKESVDLIKKAYSQLPTDQQSISNIIKLSLTLFGDNNG